MNNSLSLLKIKKINILLFSVLLQSLSFLTVKYASIYEAYSLFLLFLAFFLILLRAFLWQIVLRYNELSRVYPFNSLVQILIFTYAVFLFGENTNIFNIIGILLMLYGLYIIGKVK